MITPPASLIMLDNPYDPDMRRTAVNNNGESFKWDTAYRNGRYYVYFGIVPCLMYYLPLKAMGIWIVKQVFHNGGSKYNNYIWLLVAIRNKIDDGSRILVFLHT